MKKMIQTKVHILSEANKDEVCENKLSQPDD